MRARNGGGTNFREWGRLHNDAVIKLTLREEWEFGSRTPGFCNSPGER